MQVFAAGQVGGIDLDHRADDLDRPVGPRVGERGCLDTLLRRRHGARENDEPGAVAGFSQYLEGAGELVGVGNGNPHNVDSFKRPRRWTWHGKALAILRPAKQPGRLTLTATAEGLRAARLDLQVAGRPS